MSRNSRLAHDIEPSSDGTIESHSMGYVPKNERHFKLSRQEPFWFLSRFHFFILAIGFVGLSLGSASPWTMLAGALCIMSGTIFVGFSYYPGEQIQSKKALAMSQQEDLKELVDLVRQDEQFAAAVVNSAIPIDRQSSLSHQLLTMRIDELSRRYGLL